MESIAQKLLEVRPPDYVPLDSNSLRHFVVSLDKVGQVGEGNSKIDLVFLEPLFLWLILHIDPIGLCVGKKEPWNLGSASDFPVPKPNRIHILIITNKHKAIIFSSWVFYIWKGTARPSPPVLPQLGLLSGGKCTVHAGLLPASYKFYGYLWLLTLL